jgi:hypothetical protein
MYLVALTLPQQGIRNAIVPKKRGHPHRNELLNIIVRHSAIKDCRILKEKRVAISGRIAKSGRQVSR